MELTYPDELSPPPLPFRLRLPDGWQARPHATAAGFAVDTRSPDGFTVNLVVLLTRVLTDADLDQLVTDTQAAGTAGLTVRELGRQRGSTSGWETRYSVRTFDDGTLPFPLFQAQAALLVPRTESVREFVHCYATCPAALSDRYAATFRQMFDSLRVG